MDDIPDDMLLRRKPLADALRAKGYPIAATTLASRVTRGGGPPFRLFGKIPLYRWGDALAWAQKRLSDPRSSTSEGHEPPTHQVSETKAARGPANPARRLRGTRSALAQGKPDRKAAT